MQTKSVMIQTLCVPCACRCRYCLLSWDGRCVGADYDRSQRLAERFYTWLKQTHPELTFNFAFGYSMDHPKLLDALDFLNGIGSVTGRFLQCDGMAFRSEEELNDLMSGLQAHGVRALNFTFYGTEAYHDRFAGRRGDFAHLLSMARAARGQSLSVSAGVPLTRENAGQAEALLRILQEAGLFDVRLFVPHGEGRGAALEPVRLREEDLWALPINLREKLNRKVYQTEAEWCKIGGGEPEKSRTLLLSLTEQNMDRLERTAFDEIIESLEALDEAYYAAFPSFKALLEAYGDREGTKLYSRRDLFARLRGMYKKEHGVSVYDVTDERQSGSRRY